MSFLRNLPYITYDFTSKVDNSQVIATIPDLTTKIEFNLSALDLPTLCNRYTIQGTELPEHIAQKFYKSTEHAWTILVINGIGNLSNEWPLSDIELVNLATAKYGAANIYATHHYEKLPEGLVMDQSFILSMYGSNSINTVSNMDYETVLNEAKRIIWIIKPQFLNDFVSQYNSALGF